MSSGGWLFQVRANTGTTYRFWSGLGDLSLLGHTWRGASGIVAVSEAQATAGLPNRRAQIVVDMAADKTQRVAFLQDIGPAPAVVYWIADTGSGWEATNFQSAGRLSAPKLGITGKVTFEIETLAALMDLKINHVWSHEDQKRRDEEDDGLEYMEALAARTIRDDWPPSRRA